MIKNAFFRTLGIVFGVINIGSIGLVFGEERSADQAYSYTESRSEEPESESNQSQLPEGDGTAVQSTAVVTSHYYCDNLPINAASLSSNSLEIIVHRDTRMPTVVASLVCNVGAADAPIQKGGIVELITANLISKDMRKSFKKAGIDCSVMCDASHTEIRAFMHPKRLKKFFEICKDVAKSIVLDSERLEIQKKQMIIANDLANCDMDNALQDNVLARYMPQSIFNEEALKSITVADVKQFFDENYRDQVVLVNICGDVDWVPTLDQKKQLAERYHNTSKKAVHYRTPENASFDLASAPNIRLESKYVGNSLGYLYLVNDSKDKQLLAILLDLLDYEMFRYFSKTHSAIHVASAGLTFSREDEVVSVSLAPKMDVSLRGLGRIYENFVQKIAKVAPKKEVLQKIAQRKKISFDILLGDLAATNSYITAAHISNTFNERFYPNNAIAFADPEELRKLAEKIFLHQIITTVITRYRSDR